MSTHDPYAPAPYGSTTDASPLSGSPTYAPVGTAYAPIGTADAPVAGPEAAYAPPPYGPPAPFGPPAPGFPPYAPAPTPPVQRPAAWGPSAATPYGPAPYGPATPGLAAGGGWGGVQPVRYVPELAGWGSRVAALLIDVAIMLVPFLPPYVYALVTAEYGISATGTQTSSFTPAGGFAMAVAFLWVFGSWIWNRVVRQGRTGQSWGKKALGIRLIGARTMVPPGAGLAFGREVAHRLDEIAYIGYLWPLWDDQRRTFADMIASTVVVRD